MRDWVDKIKVLQEDIRGNFPRQKEWLEGTLAGVEREKEREYLAGLGVDDTVLETLAQLFPEGAAPIAVSVLGQFDGLAKGIVTLQKYANQGKFYGDCYRSRGDCEAIPSVVFLEPEHGEVVFSDPESPEYRRVMGRIETDEKLREHTRAPWAVFDVASINRVLGLPGPSQEARKRLEDHKADVYVVRNYRKSSRSTFYLLNMLTAHCAVPVNIENREGKIEELQGLMMDNYRRQEARVQSRLEEAVDVPVDTRLAVPKVKRGMLDTLASMFPNGAAAVSTAVLSQFDTTISPPTIKGLIEEGRFYGEVYRSRGEGAESPRVLFLEPSNIGDVFQEGESIEREALMRELAVGKLTDITNRGPWKLFDVSEIYSVAGIPTCEAGVRDALKDNEHVYAVPNHGKNVRVVYYLLTLNNIEHILPSGLASREERAKRLQESILGNYGRQKAWVDKKLEELARDEHRREDARIGTMGFEAEVGEMLRNMFFDPVVPVPTAVLGKMNSTREYPTILGRTRKGVVYGEVMKAKGKAKPVARVVFLGESDLEQMFKDTSSEECDAVRSAMKDKRFGEHTQQPWKVYDLTELNKILESRPGDKKVKDHLDADNGGIYVIPDFGHGGKSTYYLLNLETACLAVPYGLEDRTAKVRTLQQDILGNAGHQKEWVDKKLEEIAQQEAELAAAEELAAKKEERRTPSAPRSGYKGGVVETPSPVVEVPVEQVVAAAPNIIVPGPQDYGFLEEMFPEGAIAFCLHPLASWDFTKSYKLMKKYVHQGKFHAEVLKGKNKKPRVGVFEPGNIGVVFEQEGRDHYRTYRDIATEGGNGLVDLARASPWKVYDAEMISEVIGLDGEGSEGVMEELRRNGEQLFQVFSPINPASTIQDEEVYVVTMDTANLAVPQYLDQAAQKVELLRQDILGNVPRLRAWAER